MDVKMDKDLKKMLDKMRKNWKWDWSIFGDKKEKHDDTPPKSCIGGADHEQANL